MLHEIQIAMKVDFDLKRHPYYPGNDKEYSDLLQKARDARRDGNERLSLQFQKQANTRLLSFDEETGPVSLSRSTRTFRLGVLLRVDNNNVCIGSACTSRKCSRKEVDTVSRTKELHISRTYTYPVLDVELVDRSTLSRDPKLVWKIKNNMMPVMKGLEAKNKKALILPEDIDIDVWIAILSAISPAVL